MKNNEEVANVYLTQTILKKRMKLLPECDTIKKVFDGKNGGT